MPRPDPRDFKRQTGTVTQWLRDGGFGFILPDRGGPGVFFHATAVRRGATWRKGQRVEFLAVAERRGLRAMDVRAV